MEPSSLCNTTIGRSGAEVGGGEANDAAGLGLALQNHLGDSVFDPAGDHAAHRAGTEAGVVAFSDQERDRLVIQFDGDFLISKRLVDLCDHDLDYLAELG